MEQNNFYYTKEALDNREKWQTMPLNELPAKEILKTYGGKSLQQADYAARLDTLDWQLNYKIRRDGVNLLLPELQPLRRLAAALKVRFRAEIAEKRFDEALTTAKTMFALSRHLGEHPTLIGNMVGAAIAIITFSPLDEMLQQPGCPNLYWALTDLPSPFFNLRKGLQGERCFLIAEFSLLDDKEPMSESRIHAVIEKLHRSLKAIHNEDGPKTNVQDWLMKRTKDDALVSSARTRLIESGLSAERVKLFPAQQVLLLDEKLEYEIQGDELVKAMALPYWEGEKFIVDAMQSRREDGRLFSDLIPSVNKVRQVAARIDQRIGLLRGVEALRLHAAANGGKLPPKLDDLKVPVPIDPFTGKPFRYELVSDTAKLSGSPPKGMETNAAYNVRYEVTIVK